MSGTLDTLAGMLDGTGRVSAEQANAALVRVMDAMAAERRRAQAAGIPWRKWERSPELVAIESNYRATMARWEVTA